MDKIVEGIEIVVAGQPRLAFDIARDFVQEQSEGEWDDEMINRDARRIANLMAAYADAKPFA